MPKPFELNREEATKPLAGRFFFSARLPPKEGETSLFPPDLSLRKVRLGEFGKYYTFSFKFLPFNRIIMSEIPGALDKTIIFKQINKEIPQNRPP